MKKFLLSGVCALLSLTGMAQIHVYKSGHVLIGETREGWISGNMAEASRILEIDTTAVVTLDGKGYLHSNSKLSFGGLDHSSIGEGPKGYLELNSSNAISYSCGSQGAIFSYMPVPITTVGTTYPERTFNFNVSLKAKQYYTNSDMRLKKDIAILEGNENRLANLTPVSYRLNTPIKEVKDTVVVSTDKFVESERSQFGFLAQEVQAIYPELVIEDEDGSLAVDYQGFIPLLVSAVNDMQATITKQEKLINTLLSALGGVSLMNEDDNDTEKAFIGQNSPNPTNGESLISYYIPQGATTAYIELASTDGLTKQHFDIGERGTGTLTVDASRLNPGVYVYTLIVDAEEVGSHRLIVSY